MYTLPFTVRARAAFWGAVVGASMMGPRGVMAENWQALLNNPPFGQVAAEVAAPASAELEFRGVVQEDGVSYVNLFNSTTKKSQWVAVNSKEAGLEVKGYDANEEKVQVTQAGRSLTLSLKQSKVALAKVVVPNTDEHGDRDERDDRKAEIRNLIRARIEAAGGDPSQIARNLPPETQAMLDEFRRRRAERVEADARNIDAPTDSAESTPRLRRKPTK